MIQFAGQEPVDTMDLSDVHVAERLLVKYVRGVVVARVRWGANRYTLAAINSGFDGSLLVYSDLKSVRKALGFTK